MNTVIYARYSSSSQTEQSIEGQLRVCREYAERNGYNVINEYIDRATTGTNADRPAFLQMISDASKKQFEYILVYKLDRFSRDRYDSVFYKHKLKQHGVRVVSAMEAISDTQEGRLVEGLLEMMAEMYSHDLSQKVKRGLRESVLKGSFIGGVVLYGYKVINKKVVPHEEHAPIIQYVFEQYASGKTKKQIVDDLNSRGYKSYTGREFTINSFNNSLSNRRYIGENFFKGELSPEVYPAIIDKATFDKVQVKLAERKRAPAKSKAKEGYLLTGKAYCGHCGSRLVGISGTSKSKEKHSYYACSKQYREKACNKRYEKKGYLEWYVVEQTLLYILSPERAEKIADLVLAEYEKNIHVVRIKEYEKQLARIERELDRCFELMLHAESDEAIRRADGKSKDLEIQKADVQSEISKLKLACVIKHTKQDIIEWLKIFATGEPLSPEFQQRIIDVFVSAIYLFDDKIVIYYNLKGGEQVSYIEMLENIENYERTTEEADISESKGGVLISSALARQRATSLLVAQKK